MITIREEQPQDLAVIREVNLEAFGQAEEADIVDRIRQNCGDCLSLVAMMEDRVVGHIFFSPVEIDCDGRIVHGMALGPMAVLPTHQRQGIGSELVRSGMSNMTTRQCPFVILVGHPQYYPRFGFEPASGRGIRCEWEVPDEVFMIQVLSEPEMRGVSGLARYRPEFAGEAE
jgi:putative acetyltransferase